MNKIVVTLLIGGALALGTGCASSNNNGARSGVPDEFVVVKKAPLTVPPDYSLRPPELGTVRPVEVKAENQAVAAFGTELGQDASSVERMLIARAGAIAANPNIRSIIDYDESGLLRKGSTISDAVTGYSASEEELAIAAEDSATGGSDVTIARGDGRRIKLPGT